MNLYEAVQDSEEMARLHEAARWERVAARWTSKHRAPAELRWIEDYANKLACQFERDFKKWLVEAICGVRGRR